MSVPGEILVGEGPIELFDEAAVRHVEVVNTGDRPIQVGSHYHFAEANPSLSFDRDATFGCRLAIPAGTSVRFEPGIERQVGLVRLGGRRVVPGLRGLVGGPLDGDGAVGGPLGGGAVGGPVDGGGAGGGALGGRGAVGGPVDGGGAGGGFSAGAADGGGSA